MGDFKQRLIQFSFLKELTQIFSSKNLSFGFLTRQLTYDEHSAIYHSWTFGDFKTIPHTILGQSFFSCFT